LGLKRRAADRRALPAMTLSTELAANRRDILDRINAAKRRGVEPDRSVDLIAVSKQQPDDRIGAMLRTGQRVFGENRVQEAIGRWEPIRLQNPDVRLHLIGPLQSNKAEDAVRFFDSIDSVDRPKLARALADAIQKVGKSPDLLVQVNTGEEVQKAGIAPQEAAAFIGQLKDEYGLTVQGLMCIPPVEEAPAPHFKLLSKMAADLGLDTISMGMSDDFETAVRMGATQVRVGSALFGARAPRPNPAD
jgi:PLP dependent protein